MMSKARILWILGLLAGVLPLAGQLRAQSTREAPTDTQTEKTQSTHVVAESEDVSLLKTWLKRVASDSPEDREKAIQIANRPRVVRIGPELCTPDRVAFRQAARPFVGTLADLLKHPDELVVRESLDWLSKIGPEAQACVPALKARISASQDTTAFAGIETLLHVVPEETPVGAFVLETLSLTSKSLISEPLCDVRLETKTQTDGVQTEQIGGPGAVGLGISAAGYAALLADSGHTMSEVPYLLKAASPDYPTYIRAVALCIMAELGEECRVAIPRLHELIQDKDRVVAYLAANALLHVSREPGVVTQVAHELELEGRRREQFIAIAKQELAEAEEGLDFAEVWREPEMQQMLLSQIEFANGFYRRQGLRYLRRSDADIKGVEPLLRRLMNHKDGETCVIARDIVRRIDAGRSADKLDSEHQKQ